MSERRLSRLGTKWLGLSAEGGAGLSSPKDVSKSSKPVVSKPSGVRIASIGMPRSLGFDTVLHSVQNLLNQRSLR